MPNETSSQRILLTASEDSEAERLDKFLAEDLENIDGMKDAFSRERLKTLIQDGALSVNGKVIKKPAFRLKEGDQLELIIPELRPIELEPDDIPLEVIYEDKDLLVVKKPSGMLTHPAGKEVRNTLVNALLAHCEGELSGINGLLRPGIVHRLDRQTSGLLMVAKSDRAHRHLSRQLKERTAKRQYLALIQGNLKDETGSVEAPIGRNPKARDRMMVIETGRFARTHWEVLERINARFCLIRLRLETGRTHQIRVHMTHIGHPVVGDTQYGQGIEKVIRLQTSGQLLQAYRLEFIHPITEKVMTFEIPMDPDLKKGLDFLKSL